MLRNWVWFGNRFYFIGTPVKQSVKSSESQAKTRLTEFRTALLRLYTQHARSRERSTGERRACAHFRTHALDPPRRYRAAGTPLERPYHAAVTCTPVTQRAVPLRMRTHTRSSRTAAPVVESEEGTGGETRTCASARSHAQ